MSWNYKPDKIHSTVAILTIYFIVALTFIICLPSLLINREWTQLVVRKFISKVIFFIYRFLGLRIIIDGSMPKMQVIVVSNHMHALDSILIEYIVNIQNTFISKKFHKILLIYIQDFIFVKDDSGQLKGMLSRAHEEVIIKKKSIVIFPQGTRVPLHEKGIYKTTTGLLARYLHLPVIPVSINTGYPFGGYKGTNLDFSKPIYIKIHEAVVYNNVIFDQMYHQCNRLNTYSNNLDVDKLIYTIEMMLKLQGDTIREKMCEWILQKIKPYLESNYCSYKHLSSDYIKYILSNYLICDC